MISLWSGGRDKFHKCEYWLVDENENTTKRNQVVYYSQPNGIFMAKISNNEVEDKQNIDDSFQFDVSYVTLETTDNIQDLKNNNIVRFKDKIYIVESIDKVPLRKNAEQFLNDFVPYKYYISLRG